MVLRHCLGWKRLLGDDATRAFFGRFGWKDIEAFSPALNSGFFEGELLKFLEGRKLL